MMQRNNRREKILIVDDSRENIAILMDLFKDAYKIAAAITPERALKIVNSDSPPDIVLLDILMPDMDGYEVCTILKQEEQTKNIPVIFVTAVSEVMDATKGFAIGAVDYITKPFHPPMVKARVEMHLNLKRKQDLLEKFAFIDSLTEIPNRRRFDEVLAKECSRSRRSDQNLSLLMIDIDNFKLYNDTYGHGKGDVALRKLAQGISGALRRAGDFVARYGGEEFAVILPYTSKAEALKTAEQIRKSIEAFEIAHSSSTGGDFVTISIGATTVSPDSSLSLENIVEKADEALYAAKHAGRNRVEFAD